MTQASEKLSPAIRVTRSIAALLERGVRPWQRCWDASITDIPLFPLRATGEAYRGVNVVALWAAAQEKGYASPYWLTFKQALVLGGSVRKGERGHFVVFYREVPSAAPRSGEGANDDDEPKRRILRGYTVFNRVQIEGLDDRFDVSPAAATTDIEAFAARFGRIPAHVRHGGERAFYAPATDHVQMPPKPAFRDMTQYYATLAHELGHWTRHPDRLARDFGQKRFGDAGYALEELVAELCAAFVGATIGLPAEHIEDHASYIAHWLEVLRNNPSAFLTAAGRAQAAADYLLHLMGEQAAGGERAA